MAMTTPPAHQPSLATSLSPVDRIACHELAAEYFARTDRIVDRPAADLYAADGRMRMGGVEHDGREAIAAHFVERRAQEDESGRRARHFISNFVVEDADERQARVRFLCQVFSGFGEVPISSGPPTAIADCTADCIRSEDGHWLFQQLQAVVIFAGPAPTPAAR